MNPKKQDIQEELNNLIANNYNGSFARMVCEYIRTTGMTEEEVKELMEAMGQGIILVSSATPE